MAPRASRRYSSAHHHRNSIKHTAARSPAHSSPHSSQHSSALLLTLHALTSPPPNDLSPSKSTRLSTMSGTSGSSSRDWNDVLKHGSALGILKPSVAFPP